MTRDTYTRLWIPPMLNRRLTVGDKARLLPRSHRRGPDRGMRRVRNGRIVTICEIRPATHGTHRWFRIGDNGKRGGVQVWLRSDEFRGINEPLLSGGKRKNSGGRRQGAGRMKSA